jgi:hypothetical protein
MTPMKDYRRKPRKALAKNRPLKRRQQRRVDESQPPAWRAAANPFGLFSEWMSEADEKAYAALSISRVQS